MAISVKDIKEKDFSAQKHGYSIEEVDDFLDEIADQVSELIRENFALKNELQAAQEAAAASDEQVVVEQAAPDQFNDQGYFNDLQNAMRESLINANRIAEETRKAAEQEAANKVNAAAAQANAIVADANAQVEAAKAEIETLKEAAAAYRAAFLKLVEDQAAVLEASEI